MSISWKYYRYFVSILYLFLGYGNADYCYDDNGYLELICSDYFTADSYCCGEPGFYYCCDSGDYELYNTVASSLSTAVIVVIVISVVIVVAIVVGMVTYRVFCATAVTVRPTRTTFVTTQQTQQGQVVVHPPQGGQIIQQANPPPTGVVYPPQAGACPPPPISYCPPVEGEKPPVYTML